MYQYCPNNFNNMNYIINMTCIDSSIILILTLATSLLMSHCMSLFLRPSIPLIPNILPTLVDQFDKILDDEIIMTCKYLIR